MIHIYLYSYICICLILCYNIIGIQMIFYVYIYIMHMSPCCPWFHCEAKTVPRSQVQALRQAGRKMMDTWVGCWSSHWTLRIGWSQQGCPSWLDIVQKSQIIWDSLEKSKTFQNIWRNQDKHYVTRLSWAKEYQLPRPIWAPFPSGGCPAQTTTEDGRGGYVSPSTGSTMVCQRVSGIFWGWITRVGHPSENAYMSYMMLYAKFFPCRSFHDLEVFFLWMMDTNYIVWFWVIHI